MRDRKVRIYVLSGLFCNPRLDDGFCRKIWYNCKHREDMAEKQNWFLKNLKIRKAGRKMGMNRQLHELQQPVRKEKTQEQIRKAEECLKLSGRQLIRKYPLFAPFKDLLVPTPVVERTFLETDGEHRRCPLNFQSKCGNIRHNGKICPMAEKEDRMQDLGNTQYFKVETEPETGVKLVLSTVYEALTEKGYNPVNQIVGYIMSGDPTYITSHKNARSLIMKVERDELVEELLTEYIKTKHWK